jgi:hypothetical protein
MRARAKRECATLRLRQQRETIEHRSAQLVKNSEGKRRFGLDAGDPYDVNVPGSSGRVFEKCGFSDPGFAVDHENTTAPATNGVEQLVEHGTLASPVDKPRSEAHRGPPHLPC